MVAIPLMALLALAGNAQEQVLPAERIGREVAQALLQRLPASHAMARIEIDPGLRDQQLPGGGARIDVGDVAGRWPRSRVGVPVALRVDGRLVRRLTVWARLRDRRQVLVYADRRAAHTSAVDLAPRPSVVDMACCVGTALVSLDTVEGMRLRADVMAGTPVLAEDFEPVPAVAARAPVEIQVRRGPVRITSRGRALGDADIGATVAVMPEGARHPVQARVVGMNKVVVE